MELRHYKTDTGQVPFQTWFEQLSDQKIRARVAARLTRVQAGLLGQANSIGAGIHELKIDTGPGYRIYFGNDRGSIIILLVGGTKQSQSKDIKRAKIYWQDYKSRKRKAIRHE